MEYQIENIQDPNSDLTAFISMRYRLETAPDIDASYTPVTDTQDILGVITPYLDVAALPSGVYVIHTYVTTEGTASGTKVTVNVDGVPV